MKTTWKTVTLGTKKPSLKGVKISSWAKELLEKVTYQKEKEDIELVALTPSELGFTEYPTTTELFDRAKEQGYELCPAEVAVRLAGTVEEVGWLYIAHEPITDSDGDPDVFGVGRYGDGERWLYASWTNPGGRWDLSSRIVFRLRKSLSTQSLGNSEEELGHFETLNFGELVKRIEVLEEIIKHHNLGVWTK